MPDMRVNLAGVELKNPVVVASGTFGFGREFSEYFPLSNLGGICVKGLTVHRRDGNPSPRIAETPSGILNSVGLQNPGVDAFCEKEMPWLRQQGTRIIANISGNTLEEYAELSEKVSDAGVDLIEVNISCPNVKCGGLAFGTQPESAAAATKAVKEHAKVPVIVKLSPNVTSIVDIAKAAEDAGADALSLINTLLGMGGVSRGENAVELMMAGASAVAVGTACFTDPRAPMQVLHGMETWAEQHGVAQIASLTGTLQPWGA